MIIAVAGCVAQAEGAEIIAPRALCRSRARAADLSPPAGDGRASVSCARRRRRRCSIPNSRRSRNSIFCRDEHRAAGSRAFLSVQEGCDKFCTFCVVPYTRGAEFSRPPPQIDRRGEGAGRRGAREITLLGPERQRLSRRRRRMAPTWGLGAADPRARRRCPVSMRIRYTTSHPRDMDDELIAAHGDVPQADAVPASAGAVGLGPDARSDEPRPHRAD